MTGGVSAAERAELLEPGASALYDAFCALPSRLPKFIRPARPAEAVTWVLTMRTRYYDPTYYGGATLQRHHIHVVHAIEPPEPAEHMEVGHGLMHHQVFKASVFTGMDAETRRLYEREFSAYMAWRAVARGVELDLMGVGPQVDAWVRHG